MIFYGKRRKTTSYQYTVQNLIDSMIETMRFTNGVGLAAPQIGQSLRLVVVEYSEDEMKTPDQNVRLGEP